MRGEGIVRLSLVMRGEGIVWLSLVMRGEGIVWLFTVACTIKALGLYNFQHALENLFVLFKSHRTTISILNGLTMAL